MLEPANDNPVCVHQGALVTCLLGAAILAPLAGICFGLVALAAAVAVTVRALARSVRR